MATKNTKAREKMGKQMRFVFRNFPLKEAHPHALHAAIAAEAVGEHGEDDFRSGVLGGVNGTPTFFVNGERYNGNWADVPLFVSALRHAEKSHR